MFTKKLSEEEYESNAKTAMLNNNNNRKAKRTTSNADILSELERSRLKLRLSEESDNYEGKPNSELSEDQKLMKELTTTYKQNEKLVNSNRILTDDYRKITSKCTGYKETIAEQTSDLDEINKLNHQYCKDIENLETDITNKEGTISRLYIKINNQNDEIVNIIYKNTLKIYVYIGIIISMFFYMMGSS